MEGILHVFNACSKFGGLEFLEFLNPLSKFLEITGTFFVLRTAVFELLFELGWVIFIVQKTLHLCF